MEKIDMPDPDTVIVRIEADLTQFRREIGEVEKLATQTGSNIAGSFRGFVRELSRASKEIKTIEQSLVRLSDRTQKKFAAFSKTGLPVAQRSMVNGVGTRASDPTISGTQPVAVPLAGAIILNQATITAIRAALLRIIEGIAIGVAAAQASKFLEESGSEGRETPEQRGRSLIQQLKQAKGLTNLASKLEEDATKFVESIVPIRLRQTPTTCSMSRRTIGRGTLHIVGVCVNRIGTESISKILKSSKSRIESLTKQLEGIGDKKSPVSLLGAGVGLELAAEDNKSIIRDLIDREGKLIESLDELVPELQRLIEEPTQDFGLIEPFGQLSDCLQLLCDRLDSFGQDISFDRASTQPGDARLTLASFDPADSPFGGAGRDGLDRGLADTGARVRDLSTGFVELTQAAGGFETQGGSLTELLARTNLLFGEQSGLLGQLTAQAPVLGGELTALFEAGSQEGRVFAQVTDALGASLLDAFEGAIQRGESLSDVLKGLALDIARLAAQRGGETLAPPAPANAPPPALAMAA